MKNKKFYPWLVVALLWVVALLNYMDRQMLSTMQDAMKFDIVELQKAQTGEISIPVWRNNMVRKAEKQNLEILANLAVQ